MKRFFSAFLFFLISLEAGANDAVHVAYNIDNNYVVYTLLSINSILKNNKSNSEYMFWILENGLSEKNKKMMKEYIEQRRQKVNFLSVDQNELYKGSLSRIKKIYEGAEYAHVSYVSFMRLFIPELLPDNVHKVLYLDGDTLVVQDLNELFQTDLDDFPMGMVKDISSTLKEICWIETYYNAGVILINTDKWKEDRILERALSALEERGNMYRRYVEQDLLNCLFYNDIMPLDPKWNNQVFYDLFLTPYDKTGIFHFIAWEKPWKSLGMAQGIKPYTEYIEYWNDASELRKYKYRAILNRMKEGFKIKEWKMLKKLN